MCTTIKLPYLVGLQVMQKDIVIRLGHRANVAQQDHQARKDFKDKLGAVPKAVKILKTDWRL